MFHQFLDKHQRSTELKDVTATIVRRHIHDQIANHHLKPRSMQRKISTLKSFCKYGLKENLITSDFMGGIKAPKSDKKLPVYLNMEELKRLFSSLEQAENLFASHNAPVKVTNLIFSAWSHLIKLLRAN